MLRARQGYPETRKVFTEALLPHIVNQYTEWSGKHTGIRTSFDTYDGKLTVFTTVGMTRDATRMEHTITLGCRQKETSAPYGAVTSLLATTQLCSYMYMYPVASTAPQHGSEIWILPTTESCMSMRRRRVV